VGDLVSLLPAGGVAVAFVILIGYLINGNRLDRTEYRKAVEEADDRTEAERIRNVDLQRQLDAERELRRKAEDTASRAASATERAADEIKALRERVGDLERQLARVAGASS
jgi:HAMP domain-containing protein